MNSNINSDIIKLRANSIGYRYRSNLLNGVYFWYRFGTGIHRLYPQIPLSYQYRPVPNHTRYIRYRYPLLGISITLFSVPVDAELIKSCSNVSMQVNAPFRLLFIHTVSKLYFV
ncbi:hypothetical protein Hanom_Chr15g01404211 [Helianthus anomalus]